ncbi:MAG: ATP-dependent DNA helicase RecG [Chitinophagales bacterium]|nr:ATP-dependent DNA helicase RecG [Chitinophagales bacterium]
MLELHSFIEDIPGLDSTKVSLLQKQKIFRVYDLITYYPYKYIDKTQIHSIGLLQENTWVQVKGKINNIQLIGQGRTKRLTATLFDGQGNLSLVWFQMAERIQKYLNPETTYVCFGKVLPYGFQLQMAHPELSVFKGDDSLKNLGFHPIYPTSESMKHKKLDSKALQSLISETLKQINPEVFIEFLPKSILDDLNCMSWKQAIWYVHNPRDERDVAASQHRLKFNEFFLLQMQMKRLKQTKKTLKHAQKISSRGALFDLFYPNMLPFSLTEAQKRVVKEIFNDLNSSQQMNRLLQGDVGSGKTIVAFLAMLIANGNGFQTCLMAPTEILAKQHAASLTELARDLPIQIDFLSGSVKGKERTRILTDLASGKTNIIIGTHAVIEEKVVFHNLALVVVDEQHRFGVAQRAALWAKADKPPHILIMSATPIPRTLAMTLYGDLDVSIIDELPKGRKEIKTKHIFDNKKNELFHFLKNELDLGAQAYIVYPLIEESEKIDLKNLQEGYLQVSKIFAAFGYRVVMVHGKMKADEKNKVMEDFSTGQAHILLATTVIEVGVNVPNASIMVIENADRFGLSQLHQLRGRVGRGNKQSYCFLLTAYNISADAKNRMKVMTETSNGFVIAEEDMKFRGPGDVAGTRQSGDINLKLASIASDQNILMKSNDITDSILGSDPDLNHENHLSLKKFLHFMKFGFHWELIS